MLLVSPMRMWMVLQSAFASWYISYFKYTTTILKFILPLLSLLGLHYTCFKKKEMNYRICLVISPRSCQASSGYFWRRLCPGSQSALPPSVCDAPAALPLGLQPSAIKLSQRHNNYRNIVPICSNHFSSGLRRKAMAAIGAKCNHAGF